MYLKILLFVSFSIILFSCDPDDGPELLAPEDAKTAIVENSNNLSTDIIGIFQSEGADALKDLINLTNSMDPFNGRSSLNRTETNKLLMEKSSQFKSIFIPKESVNLRTDQHGGFDFELNWGVYEWVIDGFIKTSDEGSMIIIRFPTEGSQTNNAELRITGYEETLITYDDNGFPFEGYYPTLITADLSVDGNLMVDLNFEVAYNQIGSPEEANIYLLINPYKFQLTFNGPNNQSANLSASISKHNDIIASVNLDVVFVDQENDEISVLEGFVQYLDVKISGKIDVEGLVEIDEMGVGNPNEFIDLKLSIGSQVAGTIILVEEADVDFPDETYWVPFVEYSDGSKENLLDVLEESIIELELFFDDIG